MDTDALRWLLSVADGATLTETAERFHTSQPAVTRGLRRLSEHYGVALTERDGRRLRLTFAGEIVVAAARRAVAALDDAMVEVKDADDPETGTIRLGFLSPLGAVLVPSLVGEFRAKHPGVRFFLRQDGQERIVAAIGDGDLDLVLAMEPGVDAFAWAPLLDDELFVAVSRSHPLSERPNIAISELADEPWVLMSPGYGLRQRLDELAQAAGFTPRVAFEGHDLTTLYALVGSGSGVGLFPSAPAPPAEVVQLQLNPPEHRTVGLVTAPTHVVSAAAAAFTEFVRGCAGERAR